MRLDPSEWAPRAQRLADDLQSQGDLHDPAWHAAISAVPRHVFVAEAYEQDRHGDWKQIEVTSPAGLDKVYSSTTLITALADRGTHHEGISSSTKPDLMVRMLETLEIDSGHRVLEIGTGTGYNAALLAHRLGEESVFSVDLDAELVDPARDRLDSIGYHPTLVTRDGAEGAPYDRIIATCSVPAVPQAWFDQLALDGLALVDLKRNVSAGNLVLLRRYHDRLEGRFTKRWAAFMTMRHRGERPRTTRPPQDTEGTTRTTTTPPNPWWDNRVVWFLAQFTGLPDGVTVGMHLDPDTRRPNAGTITAPDGSQAVITTQASGHEQWSVTESGPTPLWTAVEQAHSLWQRHDQPDWPRLGLTVGPDGQRTWIDSPANAL